MSEKKKLILIGGGGHCRSVIEVIERTNNFDILGIVDVEKKIGQNVSGYKIQWTDNDLDTLISKGVSFHITIGQIESGKIRGELFNMLQKKGADLPLIIAPNASVSSNALIGDGSIIMQYALVNAGAHVGNNCIINTWALIEHDARVENYCHVSTGAIVNGGAIIGEKTFIGSGAVIVHEARVQPESFIKATSLIK